MKKYAKLLAASLILGSIGLIPQNCEAAKQRLNYYYDDNCLINIKDPIGDDKGNGYYQYPSDRRLKRGTFDIKNFRVYEEGEVIVFEIQMRNYIMRTWSDSGKSDDQGFVANLWDIYVDIDGIENSGYEEALPGRDVLFADKMGWEKVIMICPMNPASIEEILRERTDELEFQDRIDDIIIPDYVEIQSDKVIAKIATKRLPRISNKSGFQCFSMGYKNVVSSNRLLNRDIKAFPTHDDFGGGSNDYGEPTIIDMIVPNDSDQYKLLNNFTTASYRDNIRYAEVPFVYANGNRISPAVEALRRTPLTNSGSCCNPQPTQMIQPINQQPRPIMQPVNQTSIPVMQPVNQQPKQIMQPITKTNNQMADPNATIKPNPNNFVPLKPVTDPKLFNNTNVPNGFVPINKK